MHKELRWILNNSTTTSKETWKIIDKHLLWIRDIELHPDTAPWKPCLESVKEHVQRIKNIREDVEKQKAKEIQRQLIEERVKQARVLQKQNETKQALILLEERQSKVLKEARLFMARNTLQLIVLDFIAIEEERTRLQNEEWKREQERQAIELLNKAIIMFIIKEEKKKLKEERLSLKLVKEKQRKDDQVRFNQEESKRLVALAQIKEEEKEQVQTKVDLSTEKENTQQKEKEEVEKERRRKIEQQEQVETERMMDTMINLFGWKWIRWKSCAVTTSTLVHNGFGMIGTSSGVLVI